MLQVSRRRFAMDVPQEWLSREEMLAEKDADAFNDETFGDLGDDDGGWDDPGGTADGGWDDPGAGDISDLSAMTMGKQDMLHASREGNGDSFPSLPAGSGMLGGMLPQMPSLMTPQFLAQSASAKAGGFADKDAFLSSVGEDAPFLSSAQHHHLAAPGSSACHPFADTDAFLSSVGENAPFLSSAQHHHLVAPGTSGMAALPRIPTSGDDFGDDMWGGGLGVSLNPGP
ncbi:hypothetical protein T484DRAFT_1898467 [Baffinella frigidus]|nr:hypothetical protein T484DRAFT_1898467 [Cryptophyta sp. CCMP2293]